MRTCIKVLLCFVLLNLPFSMMVAQNGNDVSVKARAGIYIISTSNSEGYIVRHDGINEMLTKGKTIKVKKSRTTPVDLYSADNKKFLRTLVPGSTSASASAGAVSRAEQPTTREATAAPPVIESRPAQAEKPQEKPETTSERQESKDKKQEVRDKKKEAKDDKRDTRIEDAAPARPTISAQQLRDDFNAYLQDHPFYNSSATTKREDEVRKHIRLLDNLDNEQKKVYASENDIQHFLKESERALMHDKEATNQLLDDFFAAYSDYDIANQDDLADEFRDELEKRQRDWDILLDDLASSARLEYKRQTETVGWLTIAIMLGVLAVLGLCGWLIYRRSKTPMQGSGGRVPGSSAYQGADTPSGVRGQGPGAPSGTGGQGGNENIVVRRRTTSVLKKQSLEDVVNNEHYLCIECADFCANSAVRRIYIKNSCVKDIYDMYAEDLRNPANPKEDGCMVLGRWVLDGQSDQYDVSLEQIVKPGDDAIFSEYELNFGGKIKLRLAERLRKLRRETNLQYDLTCWVHSHPGLGVFFSNSDNNVQMQLKHPTQPYFLTAMVIDILTPEQTLGIFTFRRDGTVNAQTDLTRMYSLEEMYQWAIASERSAFNPHDYFNALTGCRVRHNQCRGIELGNGAIIDMAQLSTQSSGGLLGYAHGFVRTQDNLAEYVTDSVSTDRKVDGKETVGCFVVATHFSLPSVRRAVADELAGIHFVLVYSTSDDVLTAIPVLNGVMSGDDNYYGENKLEDLKIWTRRKR